MTGLFQNKIIGRFCTVDVDTWFEYFLRDQKDTPKDEKPGITLGLIREQIVKLEAKLECPVNVVYRRSSKGHVHLRVTFPHDITILDAFLLRSCLFDDLVRQNLDERRYALWGSLDEMNKCFDSKADTEGIHKSGPWIPINKGRDDLAGDAKADWLQYWDSIGREYHKPENHINLVKSHWKELSAPQKNELLQELVRGIVESDLQQELATE